ncbi:hypothetical protein [Fibrella musci]|uniref:hypothetical protein n=1 Tax=Fibrella musci TaxID=3242485 RepID=UPI003520F66A
MPQTQDILFDDFSLLEQRLGRQRLTSYSVNTNCDCASEPSSSQSVKDGSDCDYTSSPIRLRYDDRYTDQIAQPVGAAH